MPNIYQLGFFLCISAIIYHYIINTMSVFNQIQKSNIYISDGGNHFNQEFDSDLSPENNIATTTLDSDTNYDSKSDVNTQNDFELNKYKECLFYDTLPTLVGSFSLLLG